MCAATFEMTVLTQDRVHFLHVRVYPPEYAATVAVEHLLNPIGVEAAGRTAGEHPVEASGAMDCVSLRQLLDEPFDAMCATVTSLV